MILKKALFIFFFLPIFGFSQNQNDFRVWTGLSQEVDLSKKIELGFAQQIRFENNLTSIERHFYEVGLNFKLSKIYRISAAYRFSDEINTFNHRIQLDQSLNHNLPNKFWLKQRLRFQYNLDVPEYQKDDYRIRYQLNLNKKFGKDFYLYTEPEIFFRKTFDFSNFYQYRLEGGLTYEFGKGDPYKIQFYYIFEDEFNVIAPLRIHIIGFEFSISLF